MRLALAQVDPVVGDLRGNAALMIAATHRAVAVGADVVVFPELVVSGSPPGDLLLRRQFFEDCADALETVARRCAGVTVIAGVPLLERGKAYSAAAVLIGGVVAGAYKKMYLPRRALTDDRRYFDSGEGLVIVDTGRGRLALAFLDDLAADPPASERGVAAEPALGRALQAAAQAHDIDAVSVLAMAPYYLGKGAEIEALLARNAARWGVPLAYVNGVGGQDEAVFEGRSAAFDADGRVIARAPQFSERLLTVDLGAAPEGERPTISATESVATVHPVEVITVQATPASGPEEVHGSVEAEAEAEAVDGVGAPEVFSGVAAPSTEEAEVYEALCLGVRDYVGKNGFTHVVLGLSGGIDSVMAVCIAADALGPDKVTAISMPSRYSGAGTKSDAREAAARLGVAFQEISIEPLFQKYLDELALLFAGLPEDTTEQNIQARVRGNLLMAMSNKFGWLVLTAGNKSELAVGYTTLYGDMAGGFAVLKDVPKTFVYRLAHYRNGLGPGGGPIPLSAIERAPSAELAADQVDQDTLPPYELLDRIIDEYVVHDKGIEEMVAGGLERQEVERVVRMIEGNEYKRHQAPAGIKITPKAFGQDRQMPMTNRYRG